MWRSADGVASRDMVVSMRVRQIDLYYIKFSLKQGYISAATLLYMFLSTETGSVTLDFSIAFAELGRWSTQVAEQSKYIEGKRNRLQFVK